MLANTLTGIVDRRNMGERLHHLAHHGMLTALPNRIPFREHFVQARAARVRRRMTVMLIDLDHFKEVNDPLGHGARDQLSKPPPHQTMKTDNEPLTSTAIEQAAIAMSINNLMSYPWISERVRRERLHLHGWWADLQKGALWGLEQESGVFIRLC